MYEVFDKIIEGRGLRADYSGCLSRNSREVFRGFLFAPSVLVCIYLALVRFPDLVLGRFGSGEPLLFLGGSFARPRPPRSMYISTSMPCTQADTPYFIRLSLCAFAGAL